MKLGSWVEPIQTKPVARVGLRYALSVVSVALAAMLRFALDPFLGDRHLYTFFYTALAFTAWYSGFWPSILAVVLAYLIADWMLITPHFAFDFPNYSLEDFLGLAGFLGSGLAIALTTRALHRAKERAEARQSELINEVQRRERIQVQLEAAQAQLQDQAATLEKRVEDRTANLVQTVHSLEGVCYHLAHDLRAPLRAMEGYSQMLLRRATPLDEGSRQCARQVCEAAARMDKLIFCLQDYGRLGHRPVFLQTVDPERPISLALSRLDTEIQSKRAQITVVGPLPRVEADPSLLEQVLDNLLSNALKFVPAGVAPRVQIRAEQNERSVRLWIEDNGIGIAAENQDTVFRIFERLHGEESYPGRGIGLAIVAKAVQRMKGRVGVASEPGKGSRFWVELPSAGSKTDTASATTLAPKP